MCIRESNYTVEHGGLPAPLGYQGFPKSVCTSVNDAICHGIPDPNQILQDGDIINVDVTTILDGYYADASRMFLIGNVCDEARKLVEVTKESVDLALKEVKPWGRLGDIGAVISEYVHQHGYTVLRDIGGHEMCIRDRPMPATKISTLPSVSAQISGPVVS